MRIRIDWIYAHVHNSGKSTPIAWEMNPQNMVKELLDSGFRQAELGEKIGIKQFEVSRILSGRKKPDYELGKKIEQLHSQLPPNHRGSGINSANDNRTAG